jgi:transcriptional regulator with XRE-family HTH domain
MITTKSDNVFGMNLRKLRKKKGYTQTQLSEISGVSQRVIEHYEKYVKRPSIDKVKKIAHALGVSDEELLGSSVSKRTSQQIDIPYKIMKKVQIIAKLPVRDQNVVFSLINSLAEKNKAKGKL